MDRNLINVLILGLSFMFLFTSFQTGGFIQGPVIKSISEDNKDYKANTFISMGIIYFTLSIANWISPVFVKYLGPRTAMIISSLAYIAYITNFLWPQTWLLYLVSAIVGVGAAIIWNAQGYYLTLCSNDKTIARNSGIFWTLLQFSFLFGNIFVFVYFNHAQDANQDANQNSSYIPSSTRILTYIVLSIIGCIGVVAFFFLGNPLLESQQSSQNLKPNSIDIIGSIKQSFSLLTTQKMSLLCITFWYTGLELSFFSGVYTTALTRIHNLNPSGNSAQYAGLAGMIIGIGEIVGGFTFGILASKTVRWGRDPVVIIGYFTHMITFFLIFINFPPDSTSEKVTQSAYIHPNIWIAMFCSFLLGFGDACYNTQCYSALGSLYADNSAPAFALFKFFQSIASAFAFFYTNISNLYVQLFILSIFALFGTFSFIIVEWKLRQERSTTNMDRIHQS